MKLKIVHDIYDIDKSEYLKAFFDFCGYLVYDATIGFGPYTKVKEPADLQIIYILGKVPTNVKYFKNNDIIINCCDDLVFKNEIKFTNYANLVKDVVLKFPHPINEQLQPLVDIYNDGFFSIYFLKHQSKSDVLDIPESVKKLYGIQNKLNEIKSTDNWYLDYSKLYINILITNILLLEKKRYYSNPMDVHDKIVERIKFYNEYSIDFVAKLYYDDYLLLSRQLIYSGFITNSLTCSIYNSCCNENQKQMVFNLLSQKEKNTTKKHKSLYWKIADTQEKNLTQFQQYKQLYVNYMASDNLAKWFEYYKNPIACNFWSEQSILINSTYLKGLFFNGFGQADFAMLENLASYKELKKHREYSRNLFYKIIKEKLSSGYATIEDIELAIKFTKTYMLPTAIAKEIYSLALDACINNKLLQKYQGELFDYKPQQICSKILEKENKN